MVFLREVRSRETSLRIARLVRGMVRLPAGSVEFAPLVCRLCRGAGAGPRGAACILCRGRGTTGSLPPEDAPQAVVLARGPCGLGYQQLIAVALADGRPAYVHVRRNRGREAAVYVRRMARPYHAPAVPGRAPGAFAHLYPGRRRSRLALARAR